MLRRRIRAETGLTASVGAATTKLLAKLASDLAKPDGILVVEPGTELEFLHPLPVTRLWGVGPATRKRLERYGVETVGDLAALPESTLVRSARRVAPARTCTPWPGTATTGPSSPTGSLKSIGHEETFSADRTRPRRAGARTRCAWRTRSRRACGGRPKHGADRAAEAAVQRLPDDHPVPHAADADRPRGRDRRHRARRLLRAVDLGDGIRLLGVSVQQLEAGVGVQGGSTSTARRLRPPTTAGRSSRDGDGAGALRQRCGGIRGVRRAGPAPHRPRASLWGPDDEPRDARPNGRGGIATDAAHRVRSAAATSAPSTRSRSASSPTRDSSTRTITATFDTGPGAGAPARRAQPRRGGRRRSMPLLDAVDVVWICTWTAGHLDCRRSRRRPRAPGVLREAAGPDPAGLRRIAELLESGAAPGRPRAALRARVRGTSPRSCIRAIRRADGSDPARRPVLPDPGHVRLDVAQRRGQGRRRHADRALDPRLDVLQLDPGRPAESVSRPHRVALRASRDRRLRRRCTCATPGARPRRWSASGTRSLTRRLEPPPRAVLRGRVPLDRGRLSRPAPHRDLGGGRDRRRRAAGVDRPVHGPGGAGQAAGPVRRTEQSVPGCPGRGGDAARGMPRRGRGPRRPRGRRRGLPIGRRRVVTDPTIRADPGGPALRGGCRRAKIG